MLVVSAAASYRHPPPARDEHLFGCWLVSIGGGLTHSLSPFAPFAFRRDKGARGQNNGVSAPVVVAVTPCCRVRITADDLLVDER